MLTPDVVSREWIYTVAVPLIIALVELVKSLGLPSKWAPLVSLVLGLLVSFGTVLAVPEPYQHWFVTILSGCMLGLTASGLYSGYQALRPAARPEPPAPRGPAPPPGAMGLMAGLLGFILLAAVMAPAPAAAGEETLLWSQRHESQYAAPEMYAPTYQTDVYAIIWEAFEREGWPVSYNVAVTLAWCESRLDPQAARSGDAGPVGLYQFIPLTWRWASLAAGYGGRSRYDPVANAGTAAWLMARPRYGGVGHWSRFGCAWAF